MESNLLCDGSALHCLQDELKSLYRLMQQAIYQTLTEETASDVSNLVWRMMVPVSGLAAVCRKIICQCDAAMDILFAIAKALTHHQWLLAQERWAQCSQMLFGEMNTPHGAERPTCGIQCDSVSRSAMTDLRSPDQQGLVDERSV